MGLDPAVISSQAYSDTPEEFDISVAFLFSSDCESYLHVCFPVSLKAVKQSPLNTKQRTELPPAQELEQQCAARAFSEVA